MGVDTFVCGDCRETYYDITNFIQHKNEGCRPASQTAVQVIKPDVASEEQYEYVQIQSEDNPELTTQARVVNLPVEFQQESELIRLNAGRPLQIIEIEEMDETHEAIIHFPQGTVTAPQRLIQLFPSKTVLPRSECIGVNEDQTAALTISVPEDQQVEEKVPPPDDQQSVVEDTVDNSGVIHTTTGLHLVPVSGNNDGLPGPVDFQVLLNPPPPKIAPNPRGTGKRRGRPRKGPEKTPREVAKEVETPPDDVKLPLPERDADGKIRCKKCKKSFLKDRHYNSHRCLSWSDYVDISDKDAIGEGIDGHSEDEDYKDDDPTADFRLPYMPKKPRGGKSRTNPVRLITEPFNKKVPLLSDVTRQIIRVVPTSVSSADKSISSNVTDQKVGQISQVQPVAVIPMDLAGEVTGGVNNANTANITSVAGCSYTTLNLQTSAMLPPVFSTANTGESQLNVSPQGNQESKLVPMVDDRFSKINSAAVGFVTSSLDDQTTLTSEPTSNQYINMKKDPSQTINPASPTAIDSMVSDPLINDSLNVTMETDDLHDRQLSSDISGLVGDVATGDIQSGYQEQHGSQSLVDLPVVDDQCETQREEEIKIPQRLDEMKIPQRLDEIPDKPTFVDEEERMAFEQSLNSVDYGVIEELYNTHSIEQNINQNVPSSSHRTSKEILIYTCNVCEKVFMSRVHCKMHCFTHTDIKPFKCTKCDYSTNTRGNMYIHMRKHTGQYYTCSFCKFQSVIKSHLLEHMQTHSGQRHACRICKRDYSSIKTLIQHVRKLHIKTEAGRDFLKEFNTKVRPGPALLHQCHVCNRQFKKKLDRDRHLFVHDIKDNPNVFVCHLCGYTASRHIYLIKHFRRHTLVYICPDCDLTFPSSIRLLQHLEEKHLPVDPMQTESGDEACRTLYQRCIESSLFLPDPNMDDVDYTSLQNPGTQNSLVSENDEAFTDSQTPGDELQENLSTLESSDIGFPQNSAIDQNQPVVAAGQSDSSDADKLQLINIMPNSGDKSNSPKVLTKSFFEKLGYLPLTTTILEQLHGTFGNEECEFCGRLFCSKGEFEPHLSTHTGERPYACDKCDYRAITKDNLKRHTEKQHEQKVYECTKCPFKGNSRTQLWVHQKKTHSETMPAACRKCNMEFDSSKRLKIHIQMKHSDWTPDEVKKMMQPDTKTHGKLGRRLYKCPFCEKAYLRSPAELQKHQWIHQGIKPYKCPQCPHATRSKHNLESHMLRHSDDKPFLCTECGKAYKSKTALRWHVRSHKNGKLFKCTKCPYEATQNSHLKRHLETHEVVKRYICQHCDYSANTLAYMKIHYTRNHKGQQYIHNPWATLMKPMAADTKVYRCLSCDFLFGNLSDMKRHLKMRHNLRVQDLQVLENLETTETVISTTESQDPSSEVQVVHVTEPEVTTPATTEESTDSLQEVQYTEPVDEKTVSTVNLLQQIIQMTQQGAFNEQQEITVQSEDGQSLVAMNPETIIVQQETEEVVVASADGETDGNQYVIQYVTDDSQSQPSKSSTPNVEVQEVPMETDVTSPHDVTERDDITTASNSVTILNS